MGFSFSASPEGALASGVDGNAEFLGGFVEDRPRGRREAGTQMAPVPRSAPSTVCSCFSQ